MIFETGKKYRTTRGSITQDGVTTSRVCEAIYHGSHEHEGQMWHVFLYLLEDGLLAANAWKEQHLELAQWEAV